MARKTWVSVLIAIGIIVAIFCVALVGGGYYFIHRHIQTQFVGVDRAGEEFAQARARFAGQQPMIEMVSDDVVDTGSESRATLHTRVNRDAKGPGGEIKTLHVLAYDTRDGKLVHVNIPRWLLALGGRGKMRLSNIDDIDYDVGRITIEDFDRRGPALVMDVKRSRGAQVLIWTD